ncbi:hypothetical protein, partial [Ramlibacter sp.]
APAPAVPAASAGAPGPGPGRGPGPRGGRWGSGYTPGWSLMTPEERDQQREAMRHADTYEACRKAMAEHHERMAQRAAERGVQLPTPRHDACAGLPRP